MLTSDKVSVIMPAYNCEKFIGEAIDSVLAQTYDNWELIIIDDCSEDETFQIMQFYAKDDDRIIVKQNAKNLGAAESRNIAVDSAVGKYIAFLDSDDVWKKDKLKKQVEFMEDNGYSFTCTSYEKIDELSVKLGKKINALTIDYEGMLRRCPGNSTVIYDAERLGKFIIPSIRKRNDYVMWLEVIKKAGVLHGLEEVLGFHRIGIMSISSNKASLVKYHWKVYREFENLSVFTSAYLCLFWISKSVFHFQ